MRQLGFSWSHPNKMILQLCSSPCRSLSRPALPPRVTLEEWSPADQQQVIEAGRQVGDRDTARRLLRLLPLPLLAASASAAHCLRCSPALRQRRLALHCTAICNLQRRSCWARLPLRLAKCRNCTGRLGAVVVFIKKFCKKLNTTFGMISYFWARSLENPWQNRLRLNAVQAKLLGYRNTLSKAPPFVWL